MSKIQKTDKICKVCLLDSAKNCGMCKKCWAEYQRNWRAKNKDHLAVKAKINYRINKKRFAIKGKQARDKLRSELLSVYGGCCQCCGEKTPEFLAIDHIDGGGSAHRKSLKSKGGYAVYAAIKRAGFPPGYQVLCHNCNQAKSIYGICPHQKH